MTPPSTPGKVNLKATLISGLDSYRVGDIIPVVITVTDMQDVLQDPTTLKLQYTIGSIPQTALTFTGATANGVGVLAKNMQGSYTAWLDTTGKPGAWVLQAETTGVYQGASDPVQVYVGASQ